MSEPSEGQLGQTNRRSGEQGRPGKGALNKPGYLFIHSTEICLYLLSAGPCAGQGWGPIGD